MAKLWQIMVKKKICDKIKIWKIKIGTEKKLDPEQIWIENNISRPEKF